MYNLLFHCEQSRIKFLEPRVYLGNSGKLAPQEKTCYAVLFLRSQIMINFLSAQEAPPLMPALTSGRYHIKWTRLADLPVPLLYVYVAVQHHKIYVTGVVSPAKSAEHQVYVYNIYYNQWDQLPPSGHYYGIPHIIGGRLAIIGGRLSASKKMTNKVSTFDNDNQTWTSYYPDLLSVRSRPGVVSYLKHVIVAGGGLDDNILAQDDIEVLNWIENSHWRKVSIKLPAPMFGFTPTISDGDLIIVGYSGGNMKLNHNAYKLPVISILASVDQQNNTRNASTNWTKITAADHWHTAVVPSSSPPVVVGGEDATATIPSADIKMYDNSCSLWKKIGSLSSARSGVAIAGVYNNAIIVIGGCTNRTLSNAASSSLTVVELGQAEQLH